MAERKIIRGVRTDNKTYVLGMEDELAKSISQDEIDRLSAKGYLEGTWTSTKSATPTTAEPTKPATKEK